MKDAIQTEKAPKPIGCYSQAIKVGNTIYFSGQLPLDPLNMTMALGVNSQITRVFDNLQALSQACGGNLNNIVKLTIYLTDISSAPMVNDIMSKYFTEPFPARTTIAVTALPRGALVEVEAIMVV